MGDLRDALHKAGLISDKEIKKQRHEQRLHRTNKGREGLEEEKREQEEARRRRREERRARDRELEARRQEQARSEEDAARARELVRTHAVTVETRGSRRFHYVDPQGRIPYLMVNPDTGRRLEGGEWGIATDGRTCHILPRETAQEVLALCPELVLFLNGT